MMSLHRLTVGDGYAYLSRQVAFADTTPQRGQRPSDFYAQTGNPPGRWLGQGAAALGVHGEVSRDQMLALFRHGAHPDRKQIVAQQVAAGIRAESAHASARLGRRFATFSDRSRHAVAGYDLVFSPVKSVSLLWALGDDGVRRQVECAHADAVADVLGWVETNAVVTRTGRTSGQRESVHGLIGAAFDHRDSREGDPDLHTHVAVSSKVRAAGDGPTGKARWFALDGSVLLAAATAASERYTTRMEDGLAARLGVEFAPRTDTLAAGRAVVREVAGAPEDLIRHFSRRRAQIARRHDEMLREYRARYGRRPSNAVEGRLAQQATLQTRPDKAAPRSLRAQLDDWSVQAAAVGGAEAIAGLRAGIGRTGVTPARAATAGTTEAMAAATVTALEGRRASWGRWHVIAEVERQTRALRPGTPHERDRVVREVTERTLSPDVCIRLGGSAAGVTGVTGATGTLGTGGQQVRHRPATVDTGQYTSRAVLEAEQRLLAAAGEPLRPRTARARAAAPPGLRSETPNPPNPESEALVVAFTGSSRAVVAGIGPGGPAKTAAVHELCATWDRVGVRVIPLASSPDSAVALAVELGRPTSDIAGFLAGLERPAADNSDFYRLGANDIVLVDEAGFAGTVQLARLLGHARASGAGLRLLGDRAQLAAVESGPVLRLITCEQDGPQPGVAVSFQDPREAAAAVQLRAGDPACLDFYAGHGRLRSGSRHDMLEAAFQGWVEDVRSGLTSVILTQQPQDATALSSRARTERIRSGAVDPGGVPLADATAASAGDWIITRVSERTLITFKGRDFVKTGDPWTVIARHADNSLTVQHQRHRGRLTLPGEYVRENVQLAYAATVDRARALVVDSAHPVVEPVIDKHALHVAATRGRTSTTFYLTDARPQLESEAAKGTRARQLLRDALGRGHDHLEQPGAAVHLWPNSRERVERVDRAVRFRAG